MAAAVEERKNGRLVIELDADLYPFDGITPPQVLNLLYAVAQPRCSVAVGQPADVLVVHSHVLWTYVYGNDSRRHAATPGVVAGAFGAEVSKQRDKVQKIKAHAEFWGAQFDGELGQARPNLKPRIPLSHVILKVVELKHLTVGLLEVRSLDLWCRLFRCGIEL